MVKIHTKISSLHALFNIYTCGIGLFKSDIVLHFDFVIYGAILFRELLSINENLGALGIKILPNFIIKRFNDFDENGDFKAIKPPEAV